MKLSGSLPTNSWLLVLFLFTALTKSNAQSPNSFSYQAVIRNASNVLVKDQAVGVKLSILQSTSTGTAVYVETHTPTTNANGLISLAVGGGIATTGTFASIDWTAGPYFIKTETDPTGGTTYTITGTSQLLSVPFSLYATKAATAAQADNATNAVNATNATNATSAEEADHATAADHADEADEADHAATADLAANATEAVHAATATEATTAINLKSPYHVYVKAGATGGDGTQAKPYATIAEGYTAVTETGTVHILPGTYNVSTALTLNKPYITLKGYPGSIVMVQAAVNAFLILNTGVTIDGLTITSDNAYAKDLIQIQGTRHNIINNTIYGPVQSGASSDWVVNRALLVATGGVTNIMIRNNIMYSLRQPAYINAASTGHFIGNVIYNTRGIVIDQGQFVISGNSWGTPANAVDIAILVGTTVGEPYSSKNALKASNSNANIQDSRNPQGAD